MRAFISPSPPPPPPFLPLLSSFGRRAPGSSLHNGVAPHPCAKADADLGSISIDRPREEPRKNARGTSSAPFVFPPFLPRPPRARCCLPSSPPPFAAARLDSRAPPYPAFRPLPSLSAPCPPSCPSSPSPPAPGPSRDRKVTIIAPALRNKDTRPLNCAQRNVRIPERACFRRRFLGRPSRGTDRPPTRTSRGRSFPESRTILGIAQVVGEAKRGKTPGTLEPKAEG